jgi:hypothetical protein
MKGGTVRISRSARIEKRQAAKSAYQQKYRDARKGEPDNRRIAAAVLAALLELDAAEADANHYNSLFEAALNKLPRFYARESCAALIKKLREAAYELHQDQIFRKKLFPDS